ncbi:MAG: hypothetical protein Q8Q91_00345, partial [Candidatus Daviesbacteria bacterium]|nr:hypothetical protein [Candidatus Daviesbacteria bacterium]
TLQRQARPSGNDPTASITAAAGARSALLTAEEPKQEAQKESGSNDDLKKLIETLKNKLNTGATTPKTAPPAPKAKTVWNRSVVKDEKTFSPAYTVLTRISNHEKVPTRSTKSADITTKSLPDSFIFRPGADGIKIDKLNIKAGKQLGMG